MKNFYFFPILFVLLAFLQPAYGQGQEAEAGINTPDFLEHSPSVSYDAKHYVFVSNRSGKPGVYYCTLTSGGQWSEPQPVEAINSQAKAETQIGGLCLNYNASRLYFHADFDKASRGMDIYYSEFRDGKWQSPENIGEPINTPGYEGSPTVSGDLRSLYFVRDNPLNEDEDEICRSIFFSQKDAAGNWGEPAVMSYPINRTCEETPLIAPDGKTLFFASNREQTDKEGKTITPDGYNLFWTQEVASKVWTDPLYISAIASESNLLHPSISARDEYLRFAIEGEERREKIADCYKQKLDGQFLPKKTLIVKLKVNDLFSGEPLDAFVKVSDPYTSRLLAHYQSKDKGSLYFVLPGNARYKFDVSKEGYSHQFFLEEVGDITENKVLQKEIKLFPKVNLIVNLYDNEIFEPLDVKIKITDKTTGETIDQSAISHLDAGRYNLELPIGKQYKIHFEKKNYKPFEFGFDLAKIIQFDEFERDIEMEQEKHELVVHLKNKKTGSGISDRLVIENKSRKERIVVSPEEQSGGVYKVKLRKGDVYELDADPKGYYFYNTTIDLSQEQASSRYDEMSIELTPLDANTRIELRNITFESNSAELRASSATELERVVKLMKQNPEIILEISAHTDNVGSEAYNLKLSERRAESVVDYLTNEGIPLKSLRPKGYGESTPLVPNDSDENKAKNRRVEMKVLEVL